MVQRVISLCSVLLCLTAAVCAQPVTGYVNVGDYIVKAGNPNDKTEAIRQAIAEAKSRRFSGLLFPPGEYLVSDTIDISGVNEIVGQAYPSIAQTNPAKDIFYTTYAWRLTIRGLEFTGGRDQVAIGNDNVDLGFLTVSDCRFSYADGVAVRFIRDDAGGRGTASTFCLVEKCVFRDCRQTLVSVSDQTHLRDCWITTKEKPDNKAAIENYGFLTCQNIIGVPRVSGTDQRWIDNYGTLSCKMFRFGGEFAGFTPVVNYAKYVPQEGGPTITLEDCWVSALGNNRRACAIYLEEIPNQILIRGCVLGGVPAVKVNAGLDLKTYFNGARPGMLLFDIEKNIGEFAGTLPEAMIKAAANRKITRIDYGSRQLSPAATKKALAAAVAAAKDIPSAPEPGVMTFAFPPGQHGHRQVTDPAKYINITPKSHVWDLNEYVDALTELNSEYLALAPAGDDVVLMNRIDKGGWPHVRIRNITVDLDKTPFVSWRVKDNGVQGGHHAMKVINNATEEMNTLLEDTSANQYKYYAFDLRKALGIQHGIVNIDLKYYLCNNRELSGLEYKLIMKGDYFLIDFIRLEAEE